MLKNAEYEHRFMPVPFHGIIQTYPSHNRDKALFYGFYQGLSLIKNFNGVVLFYYINILTCIET